MGKKKTVSYEDGQRMASQLVIEGEHKYTEMVQLIVERTGVTQRTAKNYIKRARQSVLANECDLDTGDMDASRYKRVYEWDRRSRKYRELADLALTLPPGTESQHYKQQINYERMSLDYETRIAKTLHWDQIPPDRDMDLPEVQMFVARSLKRNFTKFKRSVLFDMYQYIGEILSDPEYGDDDEQGDSDSGSSESLYGEII